MPKVSFVLPAYKRRFFKEAIESILAQTYRDFELIVVDDCSPEGLREVVETFHDDRLIYHQNETNVGGKDLVAAWNHAMMYARGEWCVLASDDDVYESEYLAEMIALTQKYPDVNLFHCRVLTIDNVGKVTSVREPRSEFESGIEMVYNRGVKRVRQTAPEFMFRTAVLREKGGFVSLPKAWYSDDATWMMLSGLSGVVCSQKMLFHFRMSGENISSQSSDVIEKLRAAEGFRKWVKGHIEGLKATSEADEVWLTSIKRHIDNQISYDNRRMLSNASISNLWRAFHVEGITPQFRCRVIKDRFVSWLLWPYYCVRSLV